MTGLPPNKRPVNMVFQSYAVFPHMTTFQNIAYGLHMEKIAKDEITKRVDEAMNLVRMSEFALRLSRTTVRRATTARGVGAGFGKTAASFVVGRAAFGPRRQFA